MLYWEITNQNKKITFQKTYVGKPTKRYLHLMKRIKKVEYVLNYEILQA